MRKVINILLLAFCTIMTGCHDSEEAPDSVLQVIKADTNMKAAGGEVSIQIQATPSVTATSDEAWCKVAEVTEQIVRLSVEPNKEYTGRSAQIIIKDGNHTQELTLIQEGAILIYNKSELVQRTGNKAATLPVKLSSSFPVQVEIPAENKGWLSFKTAEDGNGGSFIVSENTTGKARGSDVTIISGERKLEYQVLQYEAENFVGSWKGTYISQGNMYNLPNVAITAADEEGVYTVSGLYQTSLYDYTVKATYGDNMFTLTAGQEVGTYVASSLPLTVYFCVIDSTGLPRWTSDCSIGLIPVLLSDGTFVLAFADNGGISGGVAEKISFSGFFGDPSIDSFQGHIRILTSCFFF